MALNWNIAKVKEYEKVKTEAEWAVTNLLIWATMFVGFRSITKDNYKEFYKRLHLYELVNGAFLYKDRQPKYITEAQVERRIGLETNASTFSRTEFMRRTSKHYFHK